MPSFLESIIAAFAVYRLATDLAWEDGPFALYARARGAVISRAGANHWLSEGVGCPVCLSFWLSLPAAYLWGPLSWLGVAGAVALLVRLRA
jgi:hypothetical protein